MGPAERHSGGDTRHGSDSGPELRAHAAERGRAARERGKRPERERARERWLSGGTHWQRGKADGPLRVASPEVGPTGSEKGGMTGGPELGKENMKKENRLNSNLKLILQIYSNLI
jgi:hypothetical protein